MRAAQSSVTAPQKRQRPRPAETALRPPARGDPLNAALAGLAAEPHSQLPRMYLHTLYRTCRQPAATAASSLSGTPPAVNGMPAPSRSARRAAALRRRGWLSTRQMTRRAPTVAQIGLRPQTSCGTDDGPWLGSLLSPVRHDPDRGPCAMTLRGFEVFRSLLRPNIRARQRPACAQGTSRGAISARAARVCPSARATLPRPAKLLTRRRLVNQPQPSHCRCWWCCGGRRVRCAPPVIRVHIYYLPVPTCPIGSNCVFLGLRSGEVRVRTRCSSDGPHISLISKRRVPANHPLTGQETRWRLAGAGPAARSAARLDGVPTTVPPTGRTNLAVALGRSHRRGTRQPAWLAGGKLCGERRGHEPVLAGGEQDFWLLLRNRPRRRGGQHRTPQRSARTSSTAAPPHARYSVAGPIVVFV